MSARVYTDKYLICTVTSVLEHLGALKYYERAIFLAGSIAS